jgi:hypothetical protein
MAGLPWNIYLYGLLTCFIRYEGLFLVGVAGLLLLWKRRFGLAVKLGIISFLPLLCFGVYSILKGSYFLPNSMLLKSDGLQLSVFGVARFFWAYPDQENQFYGNAYGGGRPAFAYSASACLSDAA